VLAGAGADWPGVDWPTGRVEQSTYWKKGCVGLGKFPRTQDLLERMGCLGQMESSLYWGEFTVRCSRLGEFWQEERKAKREMDDQDGLFC
jgi:hypothetical protein